MKKIYCIISLFFIMIALMGCNRNIDSTDYLIDYTKDNFKEIYSTTQVSHKTYDDFIEENYPQLSKKDYFVNWGDLSMIYGMDFDGNEVLEFIPELSWFDSIILTIDRDYEYSDIVELIQHDYPSVSTSSIEILLLTNDDVREITQSMSIVFGFQILVEDRFINYFYYEGEFHQFDS